MKQQCLGELCQFQSGLWTGKKPPFESVGVIRNANFSKLGGLDFSDLAEIQVESKQLAKRKLEFGDIILEKSGGGPKQPVGRVVLFDLGSGVYSLSNFTSFLRVKDKSVCLASYLHKYLNYIYLSGGTELIQSNSTGIRNLNLNEYKKLTVPLPPLPEQQRIVAILDEAFAAIDQAKANLVRNLKNAKELFESYLKGVLENKGDGWLHTRLGDICQINDGTHFSPKNSSEGKFMYVTAKNIKPYYIDLSNISYVSEIDHKEIYSRCSPKKGDVLYIKDGATAGIATINTIEEEFSMLSSVALLKCSDKILNTFLVHYMNSSVGKKNFLGYLDGAAITRLTLVKIKNVCFPLPPLEEQQTTVHQLDALRAETQKLEAVCQKKLLALDELKKSILQKAFTGELTTV